MDTYLQHKRQEDVDWGVKMIAHYHARTGRGIKGLTNQEIYDLIIAEQPHYLRDQRKQK